MQPRSPMGTGSPSHEGMGPDHCHSSTSIANNEGKEKVETPVRAGCSQWFLFLAVDAAT